MIDLHTHTVFSDGELIPAELARRAAVAGYRALAMTDHGDRSNLDLIIPRVARVAGELGSAWGLTVLSGIELTHVPPQQIAAAADEARGLGARIIIVHGETIVEPVAAGTNRAALEADIDILAHPGLISIEDARLAAERGIHLELTTRRGHSLCNGHVARVALETGAKLVINNDAHAPGDLLSPELMRRVALGAGLDEARVDEALANSAALVARVEKV
ncbi:histidinol phosphate phosphatase domain-containing protein [Geothermobacter hydrogeniphilus]|uniref:PHP domain-containing protein n=1 Tax=Geothermobacter hydrogeniphilus TaxID=1969733 RepID=A0A1X0Y1L2_9BACT|nr:histidinol phosphate phosphatase domain-containing protein [Geothermobacter hydrogeniphilus]ORJ59085.1 PHP domain-containing protein [Geothermobacter hydrogeniphilus]